MVEWAVAVFLAMFTRDLQPEFLGSVYGTEPFLKYCTLREIPFAQVPTADLRPQDSARFIAALSQLPHDRQFQVETELSMVNDMAGPEATAQLLSALNGSGGPADSIPGGAALALWFLLHAPDVFQEVFFNLEITDVASWKNARAQPGLTFAEWQEKFPLLLAATREFFRLQGNTDRHCVGRIYPLKDAYSFIAHVAVRPQLFEWFTDNGQYTARRLRPAVPVVFLYYPQDGTVLLHARLHSDACGNELLGRFWMAVFGIMLDVQRLGDVFRLDLFKERFTPLLDAADMKMVRVKALQLVYPERNGRRLLRLETLAHDEQFAILRLLETHGGGRENLEQLRVESVDLQITLRTRERSKDYIIRLWRNRSTLNGTALGERFRICLRQWGVYVAP